MSKKCQTLDQFRECLKTKNIPNEKCHEYAIQNLCVSDKYWYDKITYSNERCKLEYEKCIANNRRAPRDCSRDRIYCSDKYYRSKYLYYTVDD